MNYREPAALRVAVVTEVAERSADLLLADGTNVSLGWSGMSWARPQYGRNAMGPNPDVAEDILAPGDVVYLREDDGDLRLAQVPEPQAALVALSPDDGRLMALSGGYDFRLSKFNRAVQAARQPGSASSRWFIPPPLPMALPPRRW